MEIRFHQPVGKYDFLSNYFEYNFRVDGLVFRTVEHYYQSQKFKGTDMEDRLL
jgi:predicted NAD-dependent protein-ADP-ribosyltransferase YbiA (DUF1768 family)